MFVGINHTNATRATDILGNHGVEEGGTLAKLVYDFKIFPKSNTTGNEILCSSVIGYH